LVKRKPERIHQKKKEDWHLKEEENGHTLTFIQHLKRGKNANIAGRRRGCFIWMETDTIS